MVTTSTRFPPFSSRSTKWLGGRKMATRSEEANHCTPGRHVSSHATCAFPTLDLSFHLVFSTASSTAGRKFFNRCRSIRDNCIGREENEISYLTRGIPSRPLILARSRLRILLSSVYSLEPVRLNDVRGYYVYGEHFSETCERFRANCNGE